MIEIGTTVTLNYTGRIKTGEIFDTTEGKNPYQFIIGVDPLLVGFQEALMGRTTGEKFTIEIPIEKAYGEYDFDKLITVPKSILPGEVRIDQIVIAADGKGLEMKVIVTEIHDDHIIVDANHPLTGHALTYDVEILEIL
jgi:FKBP-type peptidyl-prolyl cis-trans isomerase 2